MKKICLLMACGVIGMRTLTAQWSLSGNAISAGNFLGTTNFQNLLFKAGNTNAGLLDASYLNTFWGKEAGGMTSFSATENCALGFEALSSNSTGEANVAIGYTALFQNSSGSTNTAIGVDAMRDNTTGISNTATGALPMYYSTVGTNNSVFGVNTMQQNAGSNENSAFGAYANFSPTSGLRYTDFVAPLVKSVQQLSHANDSIKNSITTLTAEVGDILEEIKNTKAGRVAGNGAILKQNIPNPSNNGTVIGYFIPASSGTAELSLSSASGQLLKVITINDRGAGQVTVSTGDFAAGIYYYSLKIDGKVVDTKRMLLTN